MLVGRTWFGIALIPLCAIVFTLLKAGDRVPDLRESFDFNAHCNFPLRSPTDVDWLWCEDRSGAPAAHVLNPLDIMLFIGDPFVAAGVPFYWEGVETSLLTFLGSYVIFSDDPSEHETAAGQLIGDATIQGNLGLLVAWLIIRHARWPGVFNQAWRRQSFRWDRMGRWTFARLSLLFGINSALYGLLGITYRGYSVGFLGGLALQSIYTAFIVPQFIRKDDLAGRNLRKDYAQLVPRWLFARLLIGLLGGGLQVRFMRSFYEQTWLAVAIVAGVMFTCKRAESRQLKL